MAATIEQELEAVLGALRLWLRWRSAAPLPRGNSARVTGKEHPPRREVEEVMVFPSRAIRSLILALLALVSALDGYVAYTAPIRSKEPGYAQPSHANAALTLAAPATIDDDDDHHSLGSGKPPDLLASEPLAPVIFAGREAWFLKARPAGQVVQHPPCAVPQTGPPAHATA